MPEHRSLTGVPIAPLDPELLKSCRVDVFRSGGKGGQHQNVTDSGVRLTHLPTRTVVISRRFRSQRANRREALATLRVRLTALNTPDKPRVPTRPPLRSLERRLSSKRHNSSKKALRCSLKYTIIY
jgi:protein subunit release factor A